VNKRNSRYYRPWLLALLLGFGTALQAETLQLHLADWTGPRDGGRILALPVVRQVMAELGRDPDSHLLIRYPGGEDGMIWVAELQAWLVALGLDSSRIQSRPGSPAADIIELEVISGKDSF